MWELEQQITKLLENYMEEAGAVYISAEDLGLDYRCGRVHISVDENWIAVEGSTKSIDYYGGFEYIDECNKKTIGEFTFYEGEECNRVSSAIERFAQSNESQTIDLSHQE
jgi:hypothetical protein